MTNPRGACPDLFRQLLLRNLLVFRIVRIATAQFPIVLFYLLRFCRHEYKHSNLRLLRKGCETLFTALGLLYRFMRKANFSEQSDIASLLACWAPIGTGDRSLYAQMFLSRKLLQADPVFAPDSIGNVLQDINQHLVDHAPGLCAAFKLRAEELALICDALGLHTGQEVVRHSP